MKKSRTKLYLAYGSNMNVDQMAGRCPTAQLLGAVTLKGWRLVFRSVADIIPSHGRELPALLWRIDEAAERALDRYEGYPMLYGKVKVNVLHDGIPVTAMVYTMQPGRSLYPPSSHYLGVIAEGYRTAKLDRSVLDEAVAESWEAYQRGLRCAGGGR